MERTGAAEQPRTQWLLVVMLLVAGLFAAAQFGKLTLTLQELRATYPEGGAFVPVLVSVVGIVGIVLGAVAGSVVARFGITRTILGALLAGGVLSLMQALLPPMPVFALLRVLEGVAHLAIVVAAPSLMASISSDADRPLVMGIWASFFGISMALLAAMLPWVLAKGGLALVFAGHGVGMIVMAALLFPLLPKARISAPGSAPVAFLAEHRVLYTTPRLLIPGAGFVWYTILYIALLALLPVALGLPVWVVTALPLVSIIGTLWGGVLAKRVTPDRLVAIGFALTALATALVWVLSPAIWPLFVLFFVMALIPAASFASIPYFNAEATDRARATGGLAQLGNVGTTLGTPLFVLAFDAAGLGLVWGIMLVFCAAGLLSTRALAARIK
jgi:predicted MFS family arabinose efflux permease